MKIMEVKKNNPFVVTGAFSLVPQPWPKPKAEIKPRPKTKREAKRLSLENKKKLDTIYAKGFVRSTRK